MTVMLAIACVDCLRAVGADDLAQRALIVYNADVADSRPLAEYYAQRRNVPTNQVCGIHIRDAETITRRELNDQIRAPILRFMGEHGLLVQQARMVSDPVLGRVPSLQTLDNQIACVVLVYGVPLRIESDASLLEQARTANLQEPFRRDEASVDSELAMLPMTGYQEVGPSRNPFFKSTAPRFEPPMNRLMVLVGRLDGPDPAVVRRMIDDALVAERDGLHGRAYFDARGIHDGGYLQGDEWIRASYRLFRDAGYECDLDDTEPVFDQDYPMTDAAIYAGWYTQNVTGPFLRDDFRFKTGAVAYHLHSFSATTVRSRNAYWVGPLLTRGAAASMGTVFEPYLALSPNLDLFFKRLLEGSTFVEAGYYSQPALSWQTTFVGDPLYRPFAVPLDDQIALLTADKNPALEWAYMRKVNLLRAEGGGAEAEELCRTKARTLSSSVLEEKVCDLLRADRRNKSAIESYRRLLDHTTGLYHKIRISAKLAAVYESDKQPGPAAAEYERVISLIPNPKKAIGYYRKAHDLAVAAGDKSKASALQARLDELLKPPTKP
jgi:uncharacterized protein (TIGR03790 family)